MFTEAIEQILADRCTPAAVRAIEAGGSPEALWSAIADAGFLQLLAQEDEGGAGLPLADFYPVVRAFGRCAMPLPVAQTIAARALAAGRFELPAGRIAMATTLLRANGAIVCPLVAEGMVAEHVLARDGRGLLLLPLARAHREASGVYASLVATLTWDGTVDAPRSPNGGAELAAFAAALNAALIAGAMGRVFEMTLQYCNDRTQFGKSLGKFQGIQHQLSVMAEQAAATGMAAEAAFHAHGQVPEELPAAIAKARTSEAAHWVAATAHALHGAIGITEEYDLQLFTRRLHEWRMAHGSEEHWNRVVGRSVLASPLTLAEFARTV